MRILCIFSFPYFIDTLFLYLRPCDHLLTYIVLILFYMWMYVFLSPTPYMCFFFSFFMHMLLITCMQSIISVSHEDALTSFVKSVSEIKVVKVYLP